MTLLLLLLLPSLVLGVMPGSGTLKNFVEGSKDTLNNDISDSMQEYVLPTGTTLWHGTVSPYTEFRTNGSPFATWFGGHKQTSLAMGFFRMKQYLKVFAETYTKTTPVNFRGKKDVGVGQPCDPPCETQGKAFEALLDNPQRLSKGAVYAMAFPNWPKLMEIESTADVKFMYVPYGNDGHWRAFKRIGFDITTKTKGGMKTLNGVNSPPGGIVEQIFTGSGICDWKNDPPVVKKLQTEGGTSPDWTYTPTETDAKFCGWRAPFDQDEFATCSKCLESFRINRNEPALADSTGKGVTQADYDGLNEFWEALSTEMKGSFTGGNVNEVKSLLRDLNTAPDAALKAYTDKLFEMIMKLPNVAARSYKKQGQSFSGAFDISAPGVRFSDGSDLSFRFKKQQQLDTEEAIEPCTVTDGTDYNPTYPCKCGAVDCQLSEQCQLDATDNTGTCIPTNVGEVVPRARICDLRNDDDQSDSVGCQASSKARFRQLKTTTDGVLTPQEK